MKFLGKTKVFAIIFYVLAILFCLYTIFAIVSTVGYLSSVMSSGMYVDVGFADMLSAFISSVGPTFFYTCVFFFCGYMIQLVAGDIIPEDQKFEELENKTSTTESETASSTTLTEPNESFTIEEIDETVELEEPVEVEETVDDVVATISDIQAQAQEEVIEEEIVEEEASEPIILGTVEEEVSEEE